jgi:hypothetical protein
VGKKGICQDCPLDPRTNVATFRMAPDYTKFHAFSAQTGISVEEDDNDPICQYNVVSDDADERVDTPYVSHAKAHNVDFDLEGATPHQSFKIDPSTTFSRKKRRTLRHFRNL